MWHSPIFVALGSNLGDKRFHLLAAREALGSGGDIVVERFSSLYRSCAMYDSAQPDFLNAVCCCRTSLSPEALLVRLKDLERGLGRVVSSRRYASRVIDLDLLYYEQRIIVGDGLVVPHPCRGERAFVLLPLEEIASNFCDPALGCSIGELVGRLGGDGGKIERVGAWE